MNNVPDNIVNQQQCNSMNENSSETILKNNIYDNNNQQQNNFLNENSSENTITNNINNKNQQQNNILNENNSENIIANNIDNNNQQQNNMLNQNNSEIIKANNINDNNLITNQDHLNMSSINLIDETYSMWDLDNLFSVFKSEKGRLYLVYSKKKSLICFDLIDEKEIIEIRKAHNYFIINLRHTYDIGSRRDFILSVSGEDNNAKIWDAEKWECIFNKNVNSYGIMFSSCFLYDNNTKTNYLVTSNCTGSEYIKIFDLNGNKITDVPFHEIKEENDNEDNNINNNSEDDNIGNEDNNNNDNIENGENNINDNIGNIDNNIIDNIENEDNGNNINNNFFENNDDFNNYENNNTNSENNKNLNTTNEKENIINNKNYNNNDKQNINIKYEENNKKNIDDRNINMDDEESKCQKNNSEDNKIKNCSFNNNINNSNNHMITDELISEKVEIQRENEIILKNNEENIINEDFEKNENNYMNNKINENDKNNKEEKINNLDNKIEINFNNTNNLNNENLIIENKNDNEEMNTDLKANNNYENNFNDYCNSDDNIIKENFDNDNLNDKEIDEEDNISNNNNISNDNNSNQNNNYNSNIRPYDDIYFIDTYYDNLNNAIFIISCCSKFVKSFNYNTNTLYKIYQDQEKESSIHSSAVVTESENIVKLIDSCMDGYIRIWNFHENILLNRIKISAQGIKGICLWDENHIFVGCDERCIKLVQFNDGIIENIMFGHKGKVCCIKQIFHEKYGKCLVSKGWGLDAIKLWVNNEAM